MTRAEDLEELRKEWKRDRDRAFRARQKEAKAAVADAVAACAATANAKKKDPHQSTKKRDQEDSLAAEDARAKTKTKTEPPKTEPKYAPPWPPDRPPRVVVVGAGPAGMCASRALTLHGVSVTTLEARDRVGGRVLSETLPELKRDDVSAVALPSVVVDLGASFVHGCHRYNPLFAMAQARSIQKFVFHPSHRSFSTFDRHTARVPFN